MLVHQLIYQGKDDAVAFRDKENVTYRQFQEMVEFYRDYLYYQGVRPGQTVGLFSRNSAEFVYSYMAIISLGAIVVPLNFQLTLREIAYIINDAKIGFLITMTLLDFSSELDNQGEVVQLVIPDFSNELSRGASFKAPKLADDFDKNHPCAIIYTSGTTGNPKGALLTHGNLVSNAQAFEAVLNVRESDVVLCVLPMYHCFSWTCSILNSLLAGASIVIMSAFMPKETLAAIKEYAVTVMYGVPPIYNLLLRIGTNADLAGVKLFVSGGASLPQMVAEQFFQKFGNKIIEGYGLSEASPVVMLNPPDKTKYCSIGKPLPGLAVKVVNQEGEMLPPGKVGELVVKGPSVMKEYFNLPLDTARAISGGWLHTGDLAYQDDEGYYFIVDRLKDMIIVNGENVYPREIEEILYAYPGVVEASVVGVSDNLRGQAVCAYIVLEEGQNLDKKALKDYLQVNLAAYKIPRDFIQVSDLPKNNTGKILKRVLLERIANTDNNDEVG
ncbi:MAG: fadD [Firmicutes bacterium]|nr:fadD [Bacillota bacterium]